MGVISTFPAGGSLSGLPAFTYTGVYALIDDGDGNWRIKFHTSGTLTFTDKDHTIDAFLVGGGGKGGYFSYQSRCGGGGGAGRTTNAQSIVLPKNVGYPIVIGAGATSYMSQGSDWAWGANGGTTTAFNVSAAGGTGGSQTAVNLSGGDGGSGGGTAKAAGGVDGSNGSGASPGTGQGTTTKEFAETAGELYANGGTGRTSNAAIVAKAPNTGDGGDGGLSAGGDGASGVVAIRNHAA